MHDLYTGYTGSVVNRPVVYVSVVVDDGSLMQSIVGRGESRVRCLVWCSSLL